MKFKITRFTSRWGPTLLCVAQEYKNTKYPVIHTSMSLNAFRIVFLKNRDEIHVPHVRNLTGNKFLMTNYSTEYATGEKVKSYEKRKNVFKTLFNNQVRKTFLTAILWNIKL